MQDRRKLMLKKPIADLHQESQIRPSYLLCSRSVKWHTRHTY